MKVFLVSHGKFNGDQGVSPPLTVAVKHGFRAKIRRRIRQFRKTKMRYLLFCLACLPAASMAQQQPDNFNQEKFEQRFRAADKDGDGRLSRAEAYAAFPKAKELFIEIDTNNDNYITLIEITQARARRVEAALNASTIGPGAKYVKPKYLKGGEAPVGGEGDVNDLSSAIAQKRSIEFDEFLGEDQNTAGDRDMAAPVKSSTSNLLNKSF
jgi:hypothetical protein